MPENRRKTGVPCGEATRWKPGQSGNPGGRPKRTPLSDACREVLALPVPGDSEGRTYAQKIAAMLANKAGEGDIRAAQELGDHCLITPTCGLAGASPSWARRSHQLAVAVARNVGEAGQD